MTPSTGGHYLRGGGCCTRHAGTGRSPGRRQEFLANPDAWWPDYAIAVEVDSREWHLSPESWEKTMRRHARMTARGILVLHFSPRQVRQEADEVLTEIRSALGARRGLSVLGIRTVAAA
jgi:hypothetical protein